MAKDDPDSSSHVEVAPVEGGLFGVRVVGITTVPAEKIYGEYKTRDLAQRIADRLTSWIDWEMGRPSPKLSDAAICWFQRKAERSCMNKKEKYDHDPAYQAHQKYLVINNQARKRGYAKINMEPWEFDEWFVDKVRNVKACEWCNEPFGSEKRQGGHVGHDHVTGECHFICQACNFIEGQARSPEHLEKIAEAMRKARRSSS